MNLYGGIFDPEACKFRIGELDSQIEGENFWVNQILAQEVMQERNRLKKNITDYDNLKSEVEEIISLIDMAKEEGVKDILSESNERLKEINITLKKNELEFLLSGEADLNNAFLEINAGAGGTESQDWAQMLLRMYCRWCEKKKYQIKYMQENQGDEAGIKSVSIKITGDYAYGWLKTESGVHRLVRISPFDSQNRRHTSFASVWVYPVIDENIIINIDDKDISIDTYRASGAGGQHVNRTDSAVRITHLETNIVVQCQSNRSQHQNKAEAYKMLRARLYELELQKKEQEKQSNESSKTDIGWGHQIRSYVLQPYQLVKDQRTGVESSNYQEVLDGDIDIFLESALSKDLK